MFHAESSNNRRELNFLDETDSGIIKVDCNAEKLVRKAKVRDYRFLCEFLCDIKFGFGSSI